MIGVEGVLRVGVLCVLGAGAGAKHRQAKTASAKDHSAFKWLKSPYFPLKCLKCVLRDNKSSKTFTAHLCLEKSLGIP